MNRHSGASWITSQRLYASARLWVTRVFGPLLPQGMARLPRYLTALLLAVFFLPGALLEFPLPALAGPAAATPRVVTISTFIARHLVTPHGVAVDGDGNLYIVDSEYSAIDEWVKTKGQFIVLASLPTHFESNGVAVDESGNVYFSGFVLNGEGYSIKEWVKSSGQVITLVSSGLNQPLGVAVDDSGNVYIADQFNNAVKEWVKSSGQVVTLVSSGLNLPTHVALDADGNVYIGAENSIVEWVKSSGQAVTIVSFDVYGPQGVALDANGNIYFSLYSPDYVGIKEWVKSSGQVINLVSSGLAYPTGVAVDNAGNAYVVDAGPIKAIKELLLAPSAATTGPAAAGTEIAGVGNIVACAQGMNPVVVSQNGREVGRTVPNVPFQWVAIQGLAPGTYEMTSGSQSGSATVAQTDQSPTGWSCGAVAASAPGAAPRGTTQPTALPAAGEDTPWVLPLMLLAGALLAAAGIHLRRV